MSLLKNIIKDSIIYAGCSAAGKLSQLIIVPFYIHCLLPGEPSLIDLSIGYALVGSTLISLCITNGMAREMSDALPADKNRFVSSATHFIFIVLGILVLGIILLSDDIQLWVTEVLRLSLLTIQTGSSLFTLLLMASLVGASLLLDVVLNHYRWSIQPRKILILTLLQILMMGVFTWLALIPLKMSLAGALGAISLSFLLTAVLGMVWQRHAFFGKFSFSALKTMLRFSIPLVPAATLAGASVYIGRFTARDTLSPQETDALMLILKVTGVLAPIFAAISQALTPHIYRDHALPDTKIQLARLYEKFLAFSLIMVTALVVVAPILFYLLGGAVHLESSRYVAIAAAATILTQSYTFFVGCWIARKTWIISTVAIGSSIITILMSLWLIPRFGVIGALGATLVAQLLALLFTAIASNHYYPVPIRFHCCGAALAIFVGIGFGSFWLPVDICLITIIKRLPLLIGVSVCIFWAGLVHLHEFYSYIQHLRNRFQLR